MAADPAAMPVQPYTLVMSRDRTSGVSPARGGSSSSATAAAADPGRCRQEQIRQVVRDGQLHLVLLQQLHAAHAWKYLGGHMGEANEVTEGEATASCA